MDRVSLSLLRQHLRTEHHAILSGSAIRFETESGRQLQAD